MGTIQAGLENNAPLKKKEVVLSPYTAQKKLWGGTPYQLWAAREKPPGNIERNCAGRHKIKAGEEGKNIKPHPVKNRRDEK